MVDDAGALLARQKEAFTAARPEPLAVRQGRLDRLEELLQRHCNALARAMQADFGQRSLEQGLLTDIGPALSLLRYCRKNLPRWTKPEKRHPTFPLGWFGARAEVRYEPKGVVGIVSPWNFPVGLTLAPLAQVLAAGNRALVKPSEFTPRSSELMAELCAGAFEADEVAFVLGGPEVGEAFCALPFDHLLFTGATGIGRHVLAAAAQNLVPVTLELGGKSPVIVSRSADLAQVGERVALGKMMNAGQVCLAPDYLLVPQDMEDAAIAAVSRSAASMYPTLLGNDDYAAVISAKHRDRLLALCDDAVAKGAEAIEVNPAGEDFSSANANKLPLTLLRNVTDEMAVMKEEIFGPLLPVMTYRETDEAIAYVNAHDRPLGLYWFGRDRGEEERVLARTISGGVTVNDVVMHVSADDLPFGGVGASGMGAYHGIEGFRTFSHARAVLRQTRFDVAKLAGLRPPYSERTKRLLRFQLR